MRIHKYPMCISNGKMWRRKLQSGIQPNEIHKAGRRSGYLLAAEKIRAVDTQIHQGKHKVNLNLMDEYQLCIHPVVVGKGLPLFKNISDRTIFTRLKTRSLAPAQSCFNISGLDSEAS